MNNGGGIAYDFYILELEDDQLVLANVSGNGVPDDPGDDEVNIWMFRPEGYIPFDTSEQTELLTGGEEKTWTWASGKCWGNNGIDAKFPAWWTLDATEVTDQDALNGAGATMTFKADGTMEKHLTNGSVETGTYKISTPVSDAWPIGSIKLSDASILFGRVANVPEGWRDVYDFGIVDLSEDQMVLGNNSFDSNDGEGWFWMFTTAK